MTFPVFVLDLCVVGVIVVVGVVKFIRRVLPIVVAVVVMDAGVAEVAVEMAAKGQVDFDGNEVQKVRTWNHSAQVVRSPLKEVEVAHDCRSASVVENADVAVLVATRQRWCR